jgi:molybdenum cofactor cytidylyltransferase
MGAAAVVIALADMPRVTATHVYRLLDSADKSDCVIASSDGTTPHPPALFGADRFDALLDITGDQGARDLIRAGRHVVTTPAELIDVDTPEELEELRRLVHAPEAHSRPKH